MAFSDANRCTAKSKSSGQQCKNPAITGTNVCRLHGGAGVRHGADNPAFTTGLHVRYKDHLPPRILDKAKAFKEGDPLDIFDELAIQRALFVEYASRFQEGIPMTVHDVETLMNFTSEIMRSVERIVKIRNDTALTGAEVAFLMARAVEVAQKYFDDPDKQDQFLAELFGQSEDSTGVSRHPTLITGSARQS